MTVAIGVGEVSGFTFLHAVAFQKELIFRRFVTLSADAQVVFQALFAEGVGAFEASFSGPDVVIGAVFDTFDVVQE